MFSFAMHFTNSQYHLTFEAQQTKVCNMNITDYNEDVSILISKQGVSFSPFAYTEEQNRNRTEPTTDQYTPIRYILIEKPKNQIPYRLQVVGKILFLFTC